MDNSVLLLNADFSVKSLMQTNPNIRAQFELLGIDFADGEYIFDRKGLIDGISRSVKQKGIVFIFDSDPSLRAREILAQGFNKPLHRDVQTAQNLAEYLQKHDSFLEEEALDDAMIPKDALALTSPNCGRAGFVMFFQSACVVLLPGEAKAAMSLMANRLFGLLLSKFYPDAVMVDVPVRGDREQDVKEYLERVTKRSGGFLPMLGGSTEHPVLRLIAVKETPKRSRQCCDSFLEDLVSECGNVTAVKGVGMRGLRAVEKRQRKKTDETVFADNIIASPKEKKQAVPTYAPAPAVKQNTVYNWQEDDELTEDEPYEEEDRLLTKKEIKQMKKQQRRDEKQMAKKEKEEAPKRSPLVKILLVLFILIFLGSMTYLAQYYWKSAQNKNAYESLREVYDNSGLIAPLGYPMGYDNDFAGLWEINKDTVGWINIDGTALDYPVVQTDDNTTYYRTNFEGEYSEHAVPFVDYSVDLKEPSSNIIIYGHNIRADGQMFNILKGYKELDYYKQHPVINFDSVYHKGQYKIISVFYTNTKSEHGKIFPYHEFIDAKDAQEAQEYIDDVLIRSIINTGVDVRPSDQLLTLSTCTYEFKDARYVVVARKVRKGENADVDTSLAQMNPNALYPDVWYQLFGGTKPDEAKLKSELPHDDVSAELLLSEPNSPDINELFKKFPEGSLIEEQDYLIESEIERQIRATMKEGSYENLEDMKNGEEETEPTIPEEVPEEVIEPEPVETPPEQPTEVPEEQPEEQQEEPAPQAEEPQQETPQEEGPKEEEPTQEAVEPVPESEEAEEAPELTEDELKEAEETEETEDEQEEEPKEKDSDLSSQTLSVKINGHTTHGSAYDIVSRMVEAEMGPTFQPEALKAQAVAAYTYVAYNNQKGVSPWVAAKDKVSSNVRSAVEDVLGEAVYYNGSYINATYCASNAGQSMDAEGVWGGYLPYLVSVDSPGDTTLKAYGATTTISEDDMAALIEDYCNEDPYDYGDPDEWFEDPEYTNGLYVDNINVCGQSLSGRAVRENLLKSKIKSAAFEVDYDGEDFTFTTYGYGHGVGMSQQGADYFAMQGWDYVDILTHYYDGTTVQ